VPCVWKKRTNDTASEVVCMHVDGNRKPRRLLSEINNLFFNKFSEMKIQPQDVEHILMELETSENKKFAKIAKSIRALPDQVKQAAALEMTTEVITFLNDAEKFYKFKLQKKSLVLNGNDWEFNVVILRRLLDISYRTYEVSMIVDTAPIDKRMDENRQKQIEIQPSLLKEEDNYRLDTLRAELDDMAEAKRDLIEACPDIVFKAFTLKLEYKDSETNLTFSIPSEIIEMVNVRRNLIGNYKMQLKPL